MNVTLAATAVAETDRAAAVASVDNPSSGSSSSSAPRSARSEESNGSGSGTSPRFQWAAINTRHEWTTSVAFVAGTEDDGQATTPWSVEQHPDVTNIMFNRTTLNCRDGMCPPLRGEDDSFWYYNFTWPNTTSGVDVVTGARNWEALLLMLVVFAGVLGNVLVCVAISVEKKLQNITNYFLMSLAVADLFVSLLVMPCSIVSEFMGYWPFGLVMCDLWQVADVMMCTSSIMHMCTISLDRYMGIREPLKMRNKSRTVVAVKMGVVWLLSFLIASPLILLGIFKPEDILSEDFQCGIFNVHFLIYGSLTAFFIPLLIMLVCYSLTIHILYRQAQKCADKKCTTVMRRSTVRRRPKKLPEPESPSPHQPQCQAVVSTHSKGVRTSVVTGTDPASRWVPKHSNGVVTPFAKRLRNGSGQGSELKHLHSDSDEDDSASKGLGALPFHKLAAASSLAVMVGGKAHEEVHEEEKPKFKRLIKKHSTAIKVAGLLMAKREDNRSKELNSVKTERKAVKVLGTMFAIFVLSWGPFFALNLANGVCEVCQIKDIVFKVFMWLGYLSSTLNPIIYTIFNRKFKRTFQAILACQHCPTLSCNCDCEKPVQKLSQSFHLNGINRGPSSGLMHRHYRYSTSFLDSLDESKV